MKRTAIYMLIVLLFSATSCLFENDMAYPDIPADIVAFEVEGQESVTIDNEARTVEVVLDEVCDMSRLKVINVAVSEDAELSEPLPEYVDLTDTLTINVRTYMDNIWTVTATQPIDRYITVENQVLQRLSDMLLSQLLLIQKRDLCLQSLRH